MTDIQSAPQEPSDPYLTKAAFNRTAAFRSIVFSLVVNALCPYTLFRFLEPCFPDESILPLLHSMTFPVVGFLFGILRKRLVDAVALIALSGIVIHFTVTVLSSNASRRWCFALSKARSSNCAS
jgi:hypothetical protein